MWPEKYTCAYIEIYVHMHTHTHIHTYISVIVTPAEEFIVQLSQHIFFFYNFFLLGEVIRVFLKKIIVTFFNGDTGD